MEAKLEKFLEYTSAFNNFGRIDFIRQESVQHAQIQCNLIPSSVTEILYPSVDSTILNILTEIDLNFVNMSTYDQFSRYVFNLKSHLEKIIKILDNAQSVYLEKEFKQDSSDVSIKYNGYLREFFKTRIDSWYNEIEEIVQYCLKKLKEYDEFHINSVHIPEIESQEEYNTSEKLLIFHYLKSAFIDQNKLPADVHLAPILGRLFTAKTEYVRQKVGTIWIDPPEKRLKRVKAFFEEIKIYPDIVKEIDNKIKGK